MMETKIGAGMMIGGGSSDDAVEMRLGEAHDQHDGVLLCSTGFVVPTGPHYSRRSSTTMVSTERSH